MMNGRNFGLVLLVALMGASVGLGDMVTITDDFSDGNYTANPAWTVESGSFTVNSERLQFGTASGTSIALNLPDAADTTSVAAQFDLRQTNGSASNHLFIVELMDSVSGKYYKLYMSPNGGYYNTTGVRLIAMDGSTAVSSTFGTAGAKLQLTAWQTVDISFDPTAGVVVTLDDVTAVSVSNTALGLNRADTLRLSSSGAITWLVDNVSVTYDAVPEPATMFLLGVGGVCCVVRQRRTK